jgi:O-antigen ligase
MHDPTVQPDVRAVADSAIGSRPARRLQLRHIVGRAAAGDRFVLAGWIALLAAIVLTLVLSPTLLTVALGSVAVLGLSRDPRLGILPAALLALMAVPHGRAADVGLASIAGVPLRFHDGVVITAGLLAIPTLRRATLRPTVVRLSLLWLAVGAVALAVGLAEGQPARDVFRDARWWLLYGFVPLAVWGAASRPAVIRALLLGATVFTLVLFATALLPAFEGGLKDRAIAYDRGLLRLQFSNSAFVVVASAWLVHRVLRRPSWATVGLFVLMASGVVLSLTRMSIFALVGVVGLSVLIAVARSLRSRRIGSTATRAAILTALLVIPVVVAVVAVGLGSAGSGATATTNPFARVFFQGANAGLDAIVRGRGETYRAALEIIAERPLLGHGLGTLVDFNFTPGGARPATPGMQPGVDNAYQTIAMKAGFVGAAAFTLLIGWPLVELARRRRRSLEGWFVVAWLAVLGLTVTQSFATSGYGPFGLALLIALPAMDPSRLRPATPPG